LGQRKEFSVVKGERKEFRSHPVDEIRRKLLMNGTYLEGDARKLVDRVKGFMKEEQWQKVRFAGGR
jgi:hypothetical protein